MTLAGDDEQSGDANGGKGNRRDLSLGAYEEAPLESHDETQANRKNIPPKTRMPATGAGMQAYILSRCRQKR
jgi:hypothetical protein